MQLNLALCVYEKKYHMISSKKISILMLSMFFTAVVGCTANEVMPQARSVEIIDEQPDRKKCKFLDEVVGYQGNWFTGEFTSIKNLVAGARNELRNEAYKLGGNIVYIQVMKHPDEWWLLGTKNTIAIGKVYKCAN
jgi:hypothetical protein